MAMQPLQSIVYQVDDGCFPASHCSKIAQYVSVWVHGQQHLACKLFIFPQLRNLHADRENPNQLLIACVLVRSLKSQLSERGEWCGKKGRAADLGDCMQPQDWGNIPSRILRYETRSSNKNCPLLEHIWAAQDSADTGLEETARSLDMCRRVWFLRCFVSYSNSVLGCPCYFVFLRPLLCNWFQGHLLEKYVETHRGETGVDVIKYPSLWIV